MNSLKRLFTSILPTSWVDDNEKPASKNQRKKLNSAFYQDEQSLDIMDQDNTSKAISSQNRVMKMPMRRRVDYNKNINSLSQDLDDDEDSQQEMFSNQKAITSEQGLNFKSKKSTQSVQSKNGKIQKNEFQFEHKSIFQNNDNDEEESSRGVDGLNEDEFEDNELHDHFEQPGQSKRQKVESGGSKLSENPFINIRQPKISQVEAKKQQGPGKKSSKEIRVQRSTEHEIENMNQELKSKDLDTFNEDYEFEFSEAKKNEDENGIKISFGSKDFLDQDQNQQDQFSFGNNSLASFNPPTIEAAQQQAVEALTSIVEQKKVSIEDRMAQELKLNIGKQKKTAIQAFKKVEGLTCPICMDFIVGCRIAICGHSFCHQCIAECLVRRKECPQCRKSIRRKLLQLSLMIDNAVKMMVLAKKDLGEPDDFERWQERTQKYKEWIVSHRVKFVKAGNKLDVCDTEHIWCKATVELVIKTQNRKDLLYLHYEGWNRKYDEYMYIDSHRVAPLGFYTQRTDIPVYRMMNNNHGGGGPVQMMYAVVLQNAAEGQRLEDYERRIAANNAQQEEDEGEMDDDHDSQGDQMEVVEVANIQDDPAEPIEDDQEHEQLDRQVIIPEPVAQDEANHQPNSQVNRQIDNQQNQISVQSSEVSLLQVNQISQVNIQSSVGGGSEAPQDEPLQSSLIEDIAAVQANQQSQVNQETATQNPLFPQQAKALQQIKEKEGKESDKDNDKNKKDKK